MPIRVNGWCVAGGIKFCDLLRCELPADGSQIGAKLFFVNGYNACIAFHFADHRRQAFSSSQLIGYSLDPNLDAEEDKNAPPQKISIVFSTADVVILGWRLGLIADYLRDNKLSAIGILPKRYAELERNTAFVSSITISPIDKSSG